jgi:hypothetical protein
LTRYGTRFSTRGLRSRSAIEFHTVAPLEASKRVTNGIPLGCSLLLPVGTVNLRPNTVKAKNVRTMASGPADDQNKELLPKMLPPEYRHGP